jgi:predicted ATPase
MTDVHRLDLSYYVLLYQNSYLVLAHYRIKRVITPVFVGRREEVTQLNALLNIVRDGSGRCALITGEAGIGKSRLLAEIQIQAEHMDFEVLVGRCFEQDRSFPYAPLIDMLRPIFAQNLSADQFEAVGSFAAELIKLLPELAPHFSLPASTPLLDSEVEKRHLFDALTKFCWHQESQPPLAHRRRPPLER